mmetsp:Transcript_102856/g.273496  ORF Transcript_102856/g.273496 Transcript_102856/m.273496 type:complete len:119 (+) Transcript_102856:227-583(+)
MCLSSQTAKLPKSARRYLSSRSGAVKSSMQTGQVALRRAHSLKQASCRPCKQGALQQRWPGLSASRQTAHCPSSAAVLSGSLHAGGNKRSTSTSDAMLSGAGAEARGGLREAPAPPGT